MLSIENPPPDTPCPCQVLVQLKSRGDGIERPPYKLSLLEVDLLNKSSLDNHHRHHHNTPLPKFSIRDYVFTARGKNIKKSWPFSRKNLQLCLKHGLKDPLPPFETLGAVRNQSIERYVVESSPIEKQTKRKFGDEPSGSNDHVVIESSSNHNQAGTCIDNSSCRSGGEHGNDLPSTAASVCHSDIDSVLINKLSDLPLEIDTTVEASAEVQASGKTHKVENATRPPGKKCRLIVKFGTHSERSSTEDITSNSTMLSESMASKICPVCKAFSSSSNTTLNAHIDQCLSDESTPKWTVDSKLTRHRIKSRKTKMMVDVYATAKPCTLEELDRRNGSCPAASNILNQASRRLEISNEGKKQRASSINPKDTGDVGAVYVDADGTKIRILSKSNDVPLVSKVEDDPGPNKAFKGNKGSKFFSTKKKRGHSSKHYKHLKLAPQSRKLFSHKTRSSATVGGQEGCSGEAESCKSEGPGVQKQIKCSDPRNLRERLCSKQAGLSRKPNKQDGHQPSFCRRNVTLDLQVQSDQHQGDPAVERNCVHKLQSSSGTSSEKCVKTEKPVYEAPDMDEREHSFRRKRVRSSLCGARIRNKVELGPLKQNENQSGKDQSHLDEDHLVKSLKTGGNCSSSLSKKVVDIDANSNPNTRVTAAAPISDLSFAFKRFRSSLKKNVSSASSRSSRVKNHLMTESRLHFMEETDEEEDVSWGPKSDQECDLVHDCSENQRGRKEITEEMSFGGSSIQGAPSGEQRGRKSISWREESTALNRMHSAPNCSDDDEMVQMENSDSSARSRENILDKGDGLESFEDAVTSLSHSAETKFNKLSNLSESRSNSLQTHGDYSGPLCGSKGLADLTDTSLLGEARMFCTEVSHDIIGQTGNVGGELDSDAAELNSFPEVDPIPIPGPPGSFLPSPRDMGSDDFQGNSSTTSRIQSSQNQLDLVDGETSDSPISAVSTISNSLEAKSDSKFAKPLAFDDNPAMLENYKSGYSTAKSEPLVENGAASPHTSAGLERTFEGEEFRVHRMSPLIFKNDYQPCCCQRKDRSSQGFALNYQESQLLRRRATASMMVPTMGMQIAANQNFSPDSLDARPETNSLRSSSSLGSDQMALSVMKPCAGSVTFKGFPDAGFKLSDRSNCDPVTPSSNPVLRLMGKNLMVVNKEENMSVPLGQAQSCAQSNHLTPKFPTSSGTTPSNIGNQGGITFRQTMPQSSLVFDHHPKDLVGQSFDVQLRNGYRNRANLGTSQTPAQFPADMFFDERIECGLTTSSMELNKYAGDYHLPAQPSRPKNRPGSDMEKLITLDYRHRNGDSAVSGKEVIVIDDAPESETNKFADTNKHFEGLRQSSLIPPSLSVLVSNHSMRHRSFSCNQPEGSLRGDPAMAQNKNFNAIPSGRASTVPFRWDCSSEGFGVPQQAPLNAVSPSRGHLRPAVYYSPSLS